MTVVLFDQGAQERVTAEMGAGYSVPEAPIDVYGDAELEEGTVQDLVERDGAQTHTRQELSKVAAAVCVKSEAA